jgi:predicted YcjX-like family ATPase
MVRSGLVSACLRPRQSVLLAEDEQHAFPGVPTSLIPSLAGWTGGTVRIGVTGLARAGKTAFLTSLAANLLAMGAGQQALPALASRVGGRRLSVALAETGASAVPRFDYGAHLDALAAEPAAWPARTGAVSLLALELAVPRAGLAGQLPPRRLRLEFLDYPGEWLLDLPLLRMTFSAWSEGVLRRLENQPLAKDFLAFSTALPAGALRDEALAATGHRLYRSLLRRLRDKAGLAYLQPGRFLMPAPGPEPPWIEFFPLRGRGGLAGLLGERYEAYAQAARDDLISPLFGKLDRLVVLADLLTALASGHDGFADTQAALSAAAGALRWQSSWMESVTALLSLRWPPPVIRRVAYAATKADHVAARQRGNLRGLMKVLTERETEIASACFAIASIRCTEDASWQLGGRSVSAVRGRVAGQGIALSYPGEVPDQPPDDAFWSHPFFALPDFEPTRLPNARRAGVPQIEMDTLLAFLLDDVL